MRKTVLTLLGLTTMLLTPCAAFADKSWVTFQDDKFRIVDFCHFKSDWNTFGFTPPCVGGQATKTETCANRSEIIPPVLLDELYP